MKLSCTSCHTVSDVAALVEIDGQFCFICRECGVQNTVQLGAASSQTALDSHIETENEKDGDAEQTYTPPPPSESPGPFTQRCPKCGYENTLTAKACHRCGLNFAFASRRGISSGRDGLEGNPAADEIRDKWTRLKVDLDNRSAHADFIQFCVMNGALQFAGTRYRELMDAHPEDERIASYRDCVIAAALAHSGRLETRAKEMVNSRLRSLLVLLFGALVLLGFAIGYYLLTGTQDFWQNH